MSNVIAQCLMDSVVLHKDDIILQYFKNLFYRLPRCTEHCADILPATAHIQENSLKVYATKPDSEEDKDLIKKDLGNGKEKKKKRESEIMMSTSYNEQDGNNGSNA